MNKIQTLIEELKQENLDRTEKMKTASEYGHSALIHQYNLTLDFIKRLENLSF